MTSVDESGKPKTQKQFTHQHLQKLVTLIKEDEPKIGSGNGEDQEKQDDGTIESYQETIDNWAEGMITESISCVCYVVLFAILIIIGVLFFLDQFGFSQQWLTIGIGQSTHSLIHFLLYAIPPIAAAVGGAFKLTERKYNDIMADMEEKKQVFKQSKRYRSLMGRETVADAITIVSTFVAAITALVS